jgi:hypothetical protein
MEASFLYLYLTFERPPFRRPARCLPEGTRDDEYLCLVHQPGNPQPEPVPSNEGELSNASALQNWELWGPWPWWD